MPDELSNRDNSPMTAEDPAASSTAEVMALLRDAASYPERPRHVILRETHISCVFLTDQFAYKLKKPLAFEFLDFRSVEARRRACEEEVRLNRRLARDIYLGVVPITRDTHGRLRIGVEDRPRRKHVQLAARMPTVVDWLVKMRRLPEDRMLDQVIESGHLRPEEIDRFADVLVRFYHAAPPLVLEPARYRADIERHVRANRAELLAAQHQMPEPIVRRVHTAQLLFMTTCTDLLAARVCDGRVIDGHGDLRPEHVCLLGTPVVYDCLEFSPELRRLDVLDELGFFAMECEMLGADFVGRRVLHAYSLHSGDHPPDALLWFYQCYRACVRAKVAALRATQLSGPQSQAAREMALRYLHLADDYATRMSAPVAIVIRGLSGSGKTTVARQLAELLGAQRLSTDDVRREVCDDGPPASFGQGKYSEGARQAVYDELLRRGDELLARGESVVFDGTFLSAALLSRVREIATSHAARLLVLTCRCSDEIAEARIAERLAAGQDTSEVRPEQRREQANLMETVPDGITGSEVDSRNEVSGEQLAAALQPLGAAYSVALGARCTA